MNTPPSSLRPTAGLAPTLPSLPALPRTVTTPQSNPTGMVRSGGVEGIRQHLPRVEAGTPTGVARQVMPSRSALLVPYAETAPGGEQIDGMRVVNPGHPDYDDAQTTALFFHQNFGHEVPFAHHLEPGYYAPQAPLGHLPSPYQRSPKD